MPPYLNVSVPFDFAQGDRLQQIVGIGVILL
jgi:hypothetical protein